MASLKPNVQVSVAKGGRARVLVNGSPVVGVVGVELIQPTVERRSPDGWIQMEKTGEPVWHIKVLSRFVNASAEKETADGDADGSR
jgi:hypothetical protein